MYDVQGTSDIESVLGIDLEELAWQDLALCDGMDTNMFYDDYESSEQVAKVVDDACLSCPVLSQCLQRGIDNNEWGCWGGIYLVSGTPDSNRNSHKTQDIWDAIKGRLGGQPLQ